MARFCKIDNYSEEPVYVSCVNPQCTEDADEVSKIPANDGKTIDTESFETLYLRGSGKVEITTSPYMLFKRAKKGGDSGGNMSGVLAISGGFADTIIGQITQEV